VWQVTDVCWDPLNCAIWSNYYFYLGDDTVIDNYKYKTLRINSLQNSGSYCSPCGGSPFNWTNELAGFLRQDTLAKKVFYRDYLKDTLLYDFNINVGDVMEGLFRNPAYPVLSIDSILIGNNFRRRINFDTSVSYCFFSIIEGIGCTNGLLSPFWQEIQTAYQRLHCFSENGMTLYNSPCSNPSYAIPCEYITLSIPLINDNNIKIYPNPVIDYFTISTRECDLPLKVEVYSISGAKLDEQAIYNDKTQINLSSYKKGTYIIRIQNKHNNVIKTEKIILR